VRAVTEHERNSRAAASICVIPPASSCAEAAASLAKAAFCASIDADDGRIASAAETGTYRRIWQRSHADGANT
jgi:hypothetical protein